VIQTTFADELRAIVGPEHVLTAEEDLLVYGYDGTWYQSRPLAVVLPGSTGEVSAIHKLATRERIALTPRAMGSGLSGGAVPLQGSLVLGVMRLNRILEIDEVNRVAVVQAGVVNADLQREVETRGLFYPPDPSSLKQSAIGGNVAENAGGARCLKYGVTGDYVAALEVVLPGGEVIRTGGKMVKNVTGYDLRR
jgi:glycolate oxidase